MENIWYIATTTIGAVVGWMWKEYNSLKTKVTSIELDVAKNYATNNSVDKLETKMDAQHALINNKLDNINQNILTVVKERFTSN